MTKFEIEEKIVSMLKTVFDPEIPVNVYDLGLIYKIDVTRNSYLHIGYNLREFHEPNYLMLGIGYRFNNKRPKLF